VSGARWVAVARLRARHLSAVPVATERGRQAVEAARGMNRRLIAVVIGPARPGCLSVKLGEGRQADSASSTEVSGDEVVTNDSTS